MPIELSIAGAKKFRISPNSKYQVVDLGNTTKKSAKFSEDLFLFEKIED